jgi:hypothetical protein
MRRLALLALTVVALVGAAAPVMAARGPSRVQVSALEFEYRLSRLSVRQGPALIELVNYGEDEHDLHLRRAGGTRTYRIGKVRRGHVGELETRFLPGRFTLWCSLADHRKRGMSASLVVRRA